MSTVILGVDPGFASFGWARIELEGGPEPVRIELGVIETTKSARKLHVLATDDNARRARELARGLIGELTGADVICAEGISFTRDASVMCKVGMAWGVLVATATSLGVPLVQASPQRVKAVACGTIKASKEDVQRAMEQTYRLRWKGKRTAAEHVYDALAAYHACRNSDVVLAALRANRAVATAERALP